MVSLVTIRTLSPKQVSKSAHAFLLVYLLFIWLLRSFIRWDSTGAQRAASKHGVILIAPDTSPRGAGIEGEDDSYDFGSGASFYVNATREPWATNYRMYAYITKELKSLVEENFPVDPEKTVRYDDYNVPRTMLNIANACTTKMKLQGIFGHSMGGHGALMIALRNPHKYVSASAFAPICNPINCPWGQKAFSGYLGDDIEQWKQYDTSCLVESYPEGARTMHILVDQGLADNFLHDPNQLQTEALESTVKNRSNVQAEIRRHEGYDHSYYFISTFIDEHIEFFAKNCQ